MSIDRALEKILVAKLKSNKVLILFGTRRVGKTVLLQTLSDKLKTKPLIMNGDDQEIQEAFQRRTTANMKNIAGNHELIVIDEAQAIPEIGKALKLMIDTNPKLTILATGSSSLDLLNKSGEPLTGRSITYQMYPIAQMELKQGMMEARQHLDDRLIYGCYPEVILMEGSAAKATYLQQLVTSYLLKDILSFSGIRQSGKIMALLRLIAYQTGSEVSNTELGNQLGLNKITVESYLDLLTKVFILHKVSAFSNNPRKEIAKSSKWFFYDNGIRNAIINDFRPIHMRNDLGALWESYVISERIKKNHYKGISAEYYFWRNYQKQEIDLIERHNGKISAYEMKYSASKKLKTPTGFKALYPGIEVQEISKLNFFEFIS